MPIAAGEQLTELQALQALLLPSANNIAAVLARWDAGSVDRFVARMNAAARSLGMTHTRYTDPSGYDDATVSTAADQVRIVDRAMRLPVFASIVATPSATLPVAGTVRNTDTLLGYDGFVGVKTGSDDAAGGCFAFRAIRWIGGKRTTITGVVLGQPGHDQITAGLAAADAMVNRIAGHARRRVRPLPGLQRRTPAPGIRTARASGAAAPRLLRRCGRERVRPAAAQPRLRSAPDRTAALDLRVEHVRDRVSAARAGADGLGGEDGLRRRGRVRAAGAAERRRRSGGRPLRPPPADDRLGRWRERLPSACSRLRCSRITRASG